MSPPRPGGRELRWLDWALSIAAALIWLLVLRAGPLSIPYFWDEADVYVPGARWVAAHGLDVTPGVFPDDYSRGHPPLLFLVAGVAFRLFGAAPLVGHLVVLPFSVLALAGTYLLGAAVFGRRVGFASALLLGSTPLFLSIGAMLLPEPPLLALTVLAFLALARGRLVTAALLGAALVLLKETGIFTAAALAGALLWDGWRRQALRRGATWLRVALVSAPLAVLCAFFLWQRLSPAGYFIFPHHQNLLWERPLGLADLLTLFPSLLLWQGRWVVTGAAAIWLVLLLAARRLELPAPAAEEARFRPLASSVVVALSLLVVANALFFAKMFWLERYALPAHPGVLILACALLLGACSRPSPSPTSAGLIAPWVPIAIATILGLASLRAPTGPNQEELTFAYADVIATHQAAYRALDERLGDSDLLIVTAWPMTIELRDPALGYVARPHRTAHVEAVGELRAEAVGAVLAPGRSRHADPSRGLARRLGLRWVATFQEGRAPPLELWMR